MTERKQKKTEATSEKKAIAPAKSRKRPASMIEPYRSSDIWMEFDKAFERFRRDFENVLWPRERVLGQAFPSLADMETNIPYIDLEDKGDRFILSAEAPGFKKDEIDINICGNSVEISGCKRDENRREKQGLRQERTHV